MIGLTALGTIHTAIGLLAVLAGLVALFRDGAISPRTGLGQVYLWSTVLTCLTGFCIFQHGGFGAPHALGVLTLLVLGLATWADRSAPFGRPSVYVVTVSYSLTLFFHMIPGMTETFTRLPKGAPLFSGPEDPALKGTIAMLFLVFLVGSAVQVRRLVSRSRRAQAPMTSRA